MRTCATAARTIGSGRPAARARRSASASQPNVEPALPLPAHRFDACVVRSAAGGQVPDGALRQQPLQRAAAVGLSGRDGQGYVDRVEVVAARPGRLPGTRASYGTRRAGARSAALPGGAWAKAGRPGPRPGVSRLAAAASVRRAASAPWKSGTADCAGARQYIRVLQLLATHPLERMRQAIELTLVREGPHGRAIIARVGALAPAGVDGRGAHGRRVTCRGFRAIHVPRPDLSRFDRFLSSRRLEPMSQNPRPCC